MESAVGGGQSQPQPAVGGAAQPAVGSRAGQDLDRLFGLMLRLTQDNWPARQKKREAGVQYIKGTMEYRQSQERSPHSRPRTPDPTDRTISKRSWERGMQLWRSELRAAEPQER